MKVVIKRIVKTISGIKKIQSVVKMAIEIISLKCPKCSSPLSGFENDWIFFCPVCSLGWDFSGSKPDQNFLKKCHLLSDAALA